MIRFCWFIGLFVVFGIVQVQPREVDLEKLCNFSPPTVNCSIDLTLVPCDDQGLIFFSDFSDPMGNTTHFRQYAVRITSCPDSTIDLTLTDENFPVERQRDAPLPFIVGNGNVIGSESISPSPGNHSNEPNRLITYNLSSSNNQVWLVANLSETFPSFSMSYSVNKPALNAVCQEHVYKGTSGTITSPGYPNAYPTKEGEDCHFIDVGTNVDYDLVFTVDVVDIAGVNGDYIQIGKGLDKLSDEDSTLISWHLEKDVKILVQGNQAHLIFKVFNPKTSTAKNKGFKINYQAIGKNLTTPAPFTTQAPTEPTPLPFDSNILQEKVVFLDNVSHQAVVVSQLVDIFQAYVNSSQDYTNRTISPPLSNETVIITDISPCYAGWNVNLKTCITMKVQVDAYLILPEQQVTYAFYRNNIQEAVKQFGAPYHITLPEELSDVYVWSLGISVANLVAILAFIMLIFLVKNRMKKIFIRSDEKLKKLPTNSSGFDNPTFNQEEDNNNLQILEYDPEQGAFAKSSNFMQQSEKELPGHTFMSNDIHESNVYRTSHPREMMNSPMETDEIVLYQSGSPSSSLSFRRSNTTQDSGYQQNYLYTLSDNLEEITLDNTDMETSTM